MMERSDKWDREWSELLTHCHGMDVQADAAFKSGLLISLKAKVAEKRVAVEAEENQSKPVDEEIWSRFLKTVYVPCDTDPEFKTSLLADLKAKQAELAQSEQSDAEAVVESKDENWGRLLQAAYVPCNANPGFKASLLTRLKTKQAEMSQTETQSVEDRNWSRLLKSAYVPCDENASFKTQLLTQLKTKQTQLEDVPAPVGEEAAVDTVLSSSYTPIKPRREFQTRLLENLKERQRSTTIIRRSSRRRTIFMSSISSIAAAAAVVFVVWLLPVDGQKPENTVAAPAPEALAMLDSISMPSEGITASAITAPAYDVAAIPVTFEPEAFDSTQTGGFANSFADFADVAAPAAGLAFAAAGSYRLSDAFSSRPLPETVRGIGMEIDSGDGWQVMDETYIANISPGMAFRPVQSALSTTGLGFGDGSTVLMCQDAELEATADGFKVRRGTLAVTVPENSEERFRLHFPERDIAIEPGTMLAVTVESGEGYAEGGAPAPLVRVADGGMAIARGKNGSGPLLANHVYRIDRYVSPDLPSRSLCEAECEELEKSLYRRAAPQSPSSGSFAPGRLPSQLVSLPMPQYRSTPAPEGFSKKGSRWEAHSYVNQPTIRIKYLSDDYFGFANMRRDLASALSLGSEVVIDGGDGNFYEIYK